MGRTREKKPIGGFFELELFRGRRRFHKGALALSTGRACISVMIEQLRPAKVFVPFYTCDAMLEPFLKYGVPLEYYNVDLQLFPVQLPSLSKNEFVLYINYFGLKNVEVGDLMNIYGEGLLVDNSHAFFAKGYHDNWSFTCARKYFGIPDGAYLYMPARLKRKLRYPRLTEVSINHSLNRLLGNNEIAYRQYTKYEGRLNSDIYAMSLYSEMVLSQVNYVSVMTKRKRNFRCLHEKLSGLNRLSFNVSGKTVPYCYPFLPFSPIDRRILHRNRLYVPCYWQDVLKRRGRGFRTEKMLSRELLPLPIDHRYGVSEMTAMARLVRKLLNAK